MIVTSLKRLYVQENTAEMLVVLFFVMTSLCEFRMSGRCRASLLVDVVDVVLFCEKNA